MLKKEINIDPERVTEKIITFIRDNINSFKRNGAIVGISGGLDSACVTALLTRAIEKNKILGLIMPERDSDDKTKGDAELVASTFNIPIKFIDLTPILESIGTYDVFPGGLLSNKKTASMVIKTGYRFLAKANNPFREGLLGSQKEWLRYSQAYYRIKHRMRMVYLYYYAEQLNYLVAGTSNKSEDMVGFFVKYGDGAADIMPIATLYKSQVRQLSEWLGVPKCIIKKPPSPDLLPGITDELALKISYEKLDLVLLGIEKGMVEREIARESGVNVKMIRYIKILVSLSEHMRNPAKICQTR